MAPPPDPSSKTRAEYTARINRVLDHIETHLAEDLALANLARKAGFSRHHFHRIFSGLVGETLGQFVRRLRLEKAAGMLLASPDEPIINICLDCGFSSQAVFARQFKDMFGLTATAWRAEHKGCQPDSNPGQANRNQEKDVSVSSTYREGNTLTWRVEMTRKKSQEMKLTTEVQVQELPAMTVAYLRHVGPYKGDEALFEGLWGRLMQWAGPRGLLANPDAQCLTIYHDNPEITDDEKLRLSVCVTAPADIQVSGAIGKLDLAGGTYAVAHFEIDASQYQDAWDAVYSGWLPESGYQPDDRPPFERALNNPKEHPQGKHLVDICMPVKPL